MVGRLLAVLVLAWASLAVAAPEAKATTPTCNGVAATIVVNNRGSGHVNGTKGRDVIVINNPAISQFVIAGDDGNDVICGSGGADVISGGQGNDTILGLGGDD